MIQNKLDLTEEELFIELGKQLQPHMSTPLDPQELASRGMKWFEVKKSKIQSVVCVSKLTNLILKEDDNIEILAIIADAIAMSILGSLPVSPFTLGAIILKVGLKGFCSDKSK